MDDDGPKLTIAAEQTEDERERTYALQDVTWRARLLAGNMLRVIAGAGEPYSLAQQSFELGKSMKDLPAGTLVGHVTEAINEALSGGLEEPEDSSELDDAASDIEQASLRMVAARLLGQRVQVTRRRRDFFEAFRRLEDIREENSRRHAPVRAKVTPAARQVRSAAAKRLAATAPPPVKPSRILPTIEPEPPQPEPRSTAEFMKRRREEMERGS